MFNSAVQQSLAIIIAISLCSPASSENWPQASGPNADWKAKGQAVTQWSVVQNNNIKWRATLPEGGQSAVTLWEDKAFVTTHATSESGDDDSSKAGIVGYCLDNATGQILWTVDLPGSVPMGSAGIFSDATVFAPISDGSHVWFFNRSGSIGCYDMDGKRIWLREYRPRTRHGNRQCEPVLINGQLLVVEVRDKDAAKNLSRHQPASDGANEKSNWTYIHGIDAKTGKVLWVEPTGTVIHNSPIVGKRANGEWAILHARGGPHRPLETPYGLTLTSLSTGKAGVPLWSTTIRNLNPMFNNHWDAERIYALAGEHHLILDAEDGHEISRNSITKDVDLWRHDEENNSWHLEEGIDLPWKKPRLNTYHTNIVVGDWHYFLAQEQNVIGRIHTRSQEIEYLEVPYQLSVSPNGSRKQIWDLKEAIPIVANNSRGINLVSKNGASSTGWGHVSAASPILVGQYLYFPVMSGTVYVIDTSAAEFSEKALAAVNDLGPAGETWTLSSFSYADQNLYIRTQKEVICIGKTE